MAEAADDKEPLWKKSQESKDDRKKFFSVLITLIIIIIVIIAAYIAVLPPEKKIIYSDLKLDGIQVRRLNDEFAGENTTRTDLEAVIYLTNDGELDSGEIKIDAYIRSFDTRGEETPCNLNDTITMGEIKTDSTGKTTLSFPGLIIHHDERYTIDFYIWEDEKVVEKASTTIKVPYVEVKPEPDVDYSNDAEEGKPGKEEEKEEASGLPGFEIIPLLISFGIILFLIRTHRYKKKSKN
jgi:hypothetical protein